MTPWRRLTVAGVALAVLVASPPARADSPEPTPEVHTDDSPQTEDAEDALEDQAEDAPRPTFDEAEEEFMPRTRMRETMPGLYPQNLGRLKGVGLWAGTPDRAFTLRIGGFTHLDSRNAFTAAQGSENNLFGRRIRLTLDGVIFKDFEYRFMWDQLIDPLFPYDFHFDWRPIHEFNIRVGGFKTPFGFERRARAYALWFTERAFPTAIAPNRSIGIFFYGQTQDGFFSYDVTVGSGAIDMGTEYELQGSPDLAGRIYFTPFRRIAPHIDALKHLGIGFSWTIGNEWASPDDPRLRRQRATPRGAVFGGRLLFDYLDDADGTSFANGLRDRQSVHAHWRHGQFNTLFEYVRSAQQMAHGLEASDPLHEAYLAHHAWQVMLSMTLHPEDENTWFGVAPKRPLDPSKGQWGGWTVSVRYHELYFDPQTFPTFADEDLWARTLRAVGTSLQWHINLLVELQLDFEVTFPRAAGDANLGPPTEYAITSRIELRY
jgi:phosphate-selective porin OprO and OprP